MRSHLTQHRDPAFGVDPRVTPEEELPTAVHPTMPFLTQDSTDPDTVEDLPIQEKKNGAEKDKAEKQDKKTDEDEEEKEPFLGLKMTQVLGGIVASSTAAVLGGQLGVAGTVVGAAFTSFTIVVGGAIYTRTFDKTKDGIGSAVSRLRLAGTPPTTVPENSEYAVPDDDATRVIAAQARAKDEVETVLPWYRRIAPVKVLVAAAGLFLIAAVVVTGLEALRGTAVSGGEGTTIGQISRGEVSSHTTDQTGRNGTAENQNQQHPVTEPTTQPAPKSTDKPVTEPTTEPTTGPTTEPTTDPTTAPTTGTTTAPTTAPTNTSGSGTDTGSGTKSGSGSTSGTGSGSGTTGSDSGTDSGSGSSGTGGTGTGSTGTGSGSGATGALTDAN